MHLPPMSDRPRNSKLSDLDRDTLEEVGEHVRRDYSGRRFAHRDEFGRALLGVLPQAALISSLLRLSAATFAAVHDSPLSAARRSGADSPPGSDARRRNVLFGEADMRPAQSVVRQVVPARC
jgi:hypothetical protein